ncbi:MAG: hypothetical protein JWM95_1358 [Gemmatimonadetes bacterium]|nr:hypothetical protein [Gemmatimonadota bacterium]
MDEVLEAARPVHLDQLAGDSKAPAPELALMSHCARVPKRQ